MRRKNHIVNIFFVWFKKPWGITFLINLIISVLIYSVHKPIHPFVPATFLFSLLISALFWSFWGMVFAIGNKYINIFAASLVALFQTILITSTYLLYSEFNEFISSDMVKFITRDAAYFSDYLSVYLFSPLIVPVAFIFTAFFLIWTKLSPRNFQSPLKRIIGFIVVIPLIVVGTHNIRHADSERMIVMDTSLLLSVKLALDYKVGKRETLHSSFDRVAVSNMRPYDPVNFVVIINESWGKSGLPFYGKKSGAVPFLERWIESEKDQFFIFEQAFSNSPATDMSVPSILTGIAPHRSNQVLHRAPFLWDWSKAAGYKAIFVSPQRYSWNSFDNFFFSPGPDYHRTALDMDSPIVNDLGVDELIATEYLKKDLAKIPPDSPFLVVYNSNALHAPFQQTSGKILSQPNFKTRYENGLFILDKAFERIYHAIKERNQIDNTVFFFTGDHSGGLSGERLPRLYSFYDESVGVPFIVRFPKEWLARHPDSSRMLKLNTTRLVANLDILPTIVQVIGLDREKQNESAFSRLDGKSLLREIDTDRIVISLNNNDVKQIKNSGFGIYFKDRRYLFSKLEGEKYFRLSDDPEEKADLWPSLAIVEKKKIMKVIDSHPHLKKIYSR